MRGRRLAVTKATYHPDIEGCSFIYRHSSATAPNGETFPVVASIVWHATWSASTGEGGDLGYLSTTSDVRDLAVAEIQALIVATDPEAPRSLPCGHLCPIPTSTSVPKTSSPLSAAYGGRATAGSRLTAPDAHAGSATEALQLVASAVNDLESAVMSGRGRIADTMTIYGIAAITADDQGIPPVERHDDVDGHGGTCRAAAGARRRTQRSSRQCRTANHGSGLMTVSSAQLRQVAGELRGFATSLGGSSAAASTNIDGLSTSIEEVGDVVEAAPLKINDGARAYVAEIVVPPD